MIITKIVLPRRTFLRGMGVTLALPFLDAMVPALSATANTVRSPTRLGFFYVPNGIMDTNWFPKGEGTNFELSPTLASLAPYRDQLIVESPRRGWNWVGAPRQGPIDVAERQSHQGDGRRGFPGWHHDRPTRGRQTGYAAQIVGTWHRSVVPRRHLRKRAHLRVSEH